MMQKMIKDVYLFMRTKVNIITVILVLALMGRLDLVPLIYGITLPALWFIQFIDSVRKLKKR